MSSKIVLASRSPSRIELLESAGIVFSSRSHMINEHKEKQNISSNKKKPKVTKTIVIIAPLVL